MLYLIYLLVPMAIQWAVVKATWAADTSDQCARGGACWVFVRVHFGQFLYGFYPEVERWRVNLGYSLIVIAAIPLFIPRFPRKGWISAFLILASPVIAGLLFAGGILGLPLVPTRLWGGLMVTLIVGLIGALLSLPLGTLLAMGRMSEMPIIRASSISFIEFWRGVPLLGVLFMSSLMLPLFLPEGMRIDKLLAALLGVVLYASAYMAETVRGGLQGIPRQQYEAAAALGIGYWKQMGLIILPQALRNVLPGIVNTFISLFKSSTLVLVVGLLDLLGIVQAAANNPEWLTCMYEGYAFAALVFWIICFSISQYSQHLERKLRIGKKRT
jgi:general L-amino acid transport system permease protein